MPCYRIPANALPAGKLLLAQANGRTHLVHRSTDSTLESLHPLDPGSSLPLIDPVTGSSLGSIGVGGEIPCPTIPAQDIPAQGIDIPARGLAVWFTGLSGSGKSTLCRMLAAELASRGLAPHVLDGDEMRRTICKGLGYARADRDENIRRIGFLASTLVRRGDVALVAAISPYRAIREEVRSRIGRFLEVYVDAPLEVCEQRDVKGLYAAARAGRITNFTGIDDPYEPPLHAEVQCRTDRNAPAECVAQVLAAIDAYPKLDA